MTLQERAKQFQPFDAMKGLQEALRIREERHARVERHEISEEEECRNSRIFLTLAKGNRVAIHYYCAFHDITKEGRITGINLPLRYLVLDEEKILFENIYRIRVLEY